MSVTSVTILKTAAQVTVETLEVLRDILGDPRAAFAYYDAVGLPSASPSAEWTSSVGELREKADAAEEAGEDPEQWARTITLAAQVINGLVAFLSATDSPPATSGEAADRKATVAIKILLPVLLEVTKRRRLPLLHALIAFVFFTDQRLQDSYPQGLIGERWYAILGDLARQAGWGGGSGDGEGGLKANWAPFTSDFLAAVVVVWAIWPKKEAFNQRLIRFWYGFDHPEIEGFEDARKLAQHAFTLLIDNGEGRTPYRSGKIEADAFLAGVKEQEPEEPPAPFALTLVPIPITMGGKSKLYVQVHGQANIDEELGGGFHLKLTNGASFGLLASPDGLEATGNVSFQAELLHKSSTQPSPGKKSAIEFRVERFALGARASVDELSAWLRVEKGELAINAREWLITSGGKVLADYVPQLRLTFDVTAEASVFGGVRFKGGAGGDLLLPINQRIPLGIGGLRIEALHLRAFLGKEGDETSFRLEAAANLTLELFSVLKLHVNGVGASYFAGAAREADGNVGGIAKTGWEPVFPKGMGLELKVWKIVGGGAFFYDAVADRLSGAIALRFADKFSLTGLGIYQGATGDSERSWLVVVSLVLPQSGSGFQFMGVGLLYGSNRTTSPEAFLAGIATGDLDAILFPEDPIGKAPQYLAALGRLFPAQKDASVLGISAKFSAFGGALTLDLGVLFDIQASSLARLYVVAQFVGIFPRPRKGEKVVASKRPVHIFADGVAIWDTRTDELNLRIVLRNSRIWAGELTGGASLFHGSPQADGGNRGTYISIGGFHPDYVPPGTKIFVPPRLALALKKGDHLKLEVRAYVAYTPSSVQFGLAGKIEARLYGFGIRGLLSFDVLMGFDGNCNIKIEASVELLVGSRSIAAVRFVGTLSGLLPSVLSGKAEVKFLFWTLSVHGSLTIHAGSVPEPGADVTGTLTSAISAPSNWESGGAPGLMLTDSKREGVWLSPSEPLTLRQPVVPLNVPIERFEGARLGAPQTLRIEKVAAGADALATTPVAGEFALGMFLELTQEEMLASRGFESRDAGFQIARPLETGAVVNTDVDFEEILLDPKKRPETEPPPLFFGVLSVFAAAAEKPAALQVRRERFTVVDAALEVQAAGLTFFEARAAIRSGLRVVPETEAAG